MNMPIGDCSFSKQNRMTSTEQNTISSPAENQSADIEKNTLAQQGQIAAANTALPPVVIAARNVGKRYEMHRHRSMLLSDMAKMAFSKYSKDYFWALRHIEFDIRKGESVALVGPNGAGKSTLLSIIAQTVYPDEGNIEVHGRVSALLELGAGFHPHFTGRENIIINGIGEWPYTNDWYGFARAGLQWSPIVFAAMLLVTWLIAAVLRWLNQRRLSTQTIRKQIRQ